MKYLSKVFIFKFIILINFFFSNLLLADNHNIYETLEQLQKDIKTLEKAVYSGSVDFNNSNNNFVFNLTNTTGNGYLKFDNVNGLVPPLGTDAQRPGGSIEVGTTRYNTEREYVETWNGSNWINAAGEVESILTQDVENLAYVFNLILD